MMNRMKRELQCWGFVSQQVLRILDDWASTKGKAFNSRLESLATERNALNVTLISATMLSVLTALRAAFSVRFDRSEQPCCNGAGAEIGLLYEGYREGCGCHPRPARQTQNIKQALQARLSPVGAFTLFPRLS